MAHLFSLTLLKRNSVLSTLLRTVNLQKAHQGLQAATGIIRIYAACSIYMYSVQCTKYSMQYTIYV